MFAFILIIILQIFFVTSTLDLFVDRIENIPYSFVRITLFWIYVIVPGIVILFGTYVFLEYIYGVIRDQYENIV